MLAHQRREVAIGDVVAAVGVVAGIQVQLPEPLALARRADVRQRDQGADVGDRLGRAERPRKQRGVGDDRR